MKETQTQRRFLITDEWQALVSSNIHMAKYAGLEIEDGYLETSAATVMRVRVERSRWGEPPGRAYLTSKVGQGRTRQIKHYPLLDVDTGIQLLNDCPYRLRKTRLDMKFESSISSFDVRVDQYHAPLDGIVVVESDDPNFDPTQLYAIEVTDSLTNFHLARLAHELSQRDGEAPIDEVMRLVRRLPSIVLTGGPCSGKSTVMETLMKEFGDRLHCVREVASIVIGQIGIKPWTGGIKNKLAAQRVMYRAQHAFEDASDSQARTDGKIAMLNDRGVGDIGAYLPGGINDLEPLVNTTVAHEFARYDLVIVLDAPSRDVFEANKGNNKARKETYEEAVSLGKRILESWGRHPNLHFIADGGISWEAKKAAVVYLVENFLRTPRP